MLKKIISISVIAIVILISAALLMPMDNENNTSVEEIETENVESIEADVIIPTKASRPTCADIEGCYVPTNIVAEKGKPVTWLNEDSAFHSVTSGLYDSPTDLFDSGHMDPYDTFSYTYDEAGVYDYYCTLHPWMEGQVIVE